MTSQWKCVLIGWSIGVVIFEIIKIGFWPVFVIVINVWAAWYWIRQTEEYKAWRVAYIKRYIEKLVKGGKV